MTIRASAGNRTDAADFRAEDGIVVNGVSVEYRTSPRQPPFRAVDRISFDIRANETLALVGESGSGKTTTARAVLQLVNMVEGTIRYWGEDYAKLGRIERRKLRSQLQMVYQSPYASLDPRMSIASIVAEPLRAAGKKGSAVDHAVREVLAAVGLGGIDLRARPGRFSGGQRQRMAIARAIVARPRFVVCDEPVSALDVSAQAQVLQILKKLQHERAMTYLFVSHDLAVVRAIADRVAVMYRGKIVELTRASALEDGLRHPYSIALRSAVERGKGGEMVRQRRIMLLEDDTAPTRTGDSAAENGGCAFRCRCWLFRALGRPDACVSSAPSLTGSAGTTVACHFAGESQEAAARLAR